MLAITRSTPTSMCPQHSLTACSHLPGCGFFQLDSTMLPPPTIPSSKLTSSIDSTPAIDIISDAAISSDSVTFPTVPVTSAALPMYGCYPPRVSLIVDKEISGIVTIHEQNHSFT